MTTPKAAIPTVKASPSQYALVLFTLASYSMGTSADETTYPMNAASRRYNTNFRAKTAATMSVGNVSLLKCPDSK